MSIERKIVKKPLKRQDKDLIAKRKKVGELLGVEKVPLHILAWQEPRLELDGGDCYPVIDVLEKIAEMISPVLSDTQIPEFCEVKEVVDDEVLCVCGFEAKTKAGLMAHQRRCETFKAGAVLVPSNE